MESPNLKFLPKSEYFFGIFYFFRIKYTEEKKCINHIILSGILFNFIMTVLSTMNNFRSELV